MNIKKHKTAIVSNSQPWDASRAILEAKTPAALMYMHAFFKEGADPAKRESYLFPHHEAGEDGPANMAAVNNSLVRVCESDLPDDQKLDVMAHLRSHRIDAGWTAHMNEAEITSAVGRIKKADDLKAHEARELMDLVQLQERSNLAEWLESRLHLSLTQFADDMFGGGRVTRNERKALSGAIGGALDSYHNFLKENAPQLFQRAPWDDAPAEDGEQDIAEGKSQNAERGEIILNESAIALAEKAVRGDGTVPVKIIQPGWGSSGYYTKEVLRRDGPKAFPKGTKMLWNHPTDTEEAERPEGDLNALASELVSDARWMDNGPKGAGLYADAKVFESFQAPVNDLAPHIGVSIHARGKGMFGSAEGQEGVIVQQILESPFNRVDYVTMPGAGGEIISLFEAARTVRADKPKAGTVPAEEATDVAKHKSNLEEDMDIKELNEKVAALETNNQTLTTNNSRLAEQLAFRDAKDMVKEALAALTSLPDITKTRLVENLSKNPPMKDGVLDKVAFKTTIDEAAKAEIKYLESVLGKGQIRGLGESQNEDDDEEQTSEKFEESLTKSFSDLGLSETGAKHAAKGRG